MNTMDPTNFPYIGGKAADIDNILVMAMTNSEYHCHLEKKSANRFWVGDKVEDEIFNLIFVDYKDETGYRVEVTRAVAFTLVNRFHLHICKWGEDRILIEEPAINESDYPIINAIMELE